MTISKEIPSNKENQSFFGSLVFAVVVHRLVDRHLDRHRLGDLDGHVLFDGNRNRFLDVVVHHLLHLERNGLLHGDGDGLNHRHRHRLGYLDVDGIRFGHGHGDGFRDRHGHRVRNLNHFVSVHGYGYVLGDFHRMGHLVASVVAALESGSGHGEAAQQHEVNETLHHLHKGLGSAAASR